MLKRQVAVVAGTYVWRICRSYKKGYRVIAGLYRSNREVGRVYNALDRQYAFGDGWYEWGSRLEWVEPLGSTHPSG